MIQIDEALRLFDQSEYDNAYDLLEKGLKKSNPFCQYWIAVMLLKKFIDSNYYSPTELFKSAFKKIKKLAIKKEDAHAQYILYSYYEEGYIFDKDQNLAYEYLKQSAVSFPRAMSKLASNYIKKIGIDNSITLLEQAAAQNYPRAFYNLSVIYKSKKYNKFNEQKHKEYLKLAINHKHPIALSNLIAFYYNTKNPSNLKKAAEILENNKGMKDPSILYFRGLFLFQGIENDRDVRQGLKLIEKASGLGDTNAIYFLGLYYLEDNSQRDLDSAKNYFLKIVEKSHSGAIYHLAVIEVMEGDYESAYKRLQPLIKKEHYKATMLAIKIYTNPKSPHRNIKKAENLLLLLVNKGHVDLYENLGKLFFENFSIDNYQKSLLYYEEGAKNGVYACKKRLASILVFSHSEEKVKKGLNLYNDLLKEYDDADLYYNVGSAYYFGRYNTKDIPKAISYFQLAADMKHPDALIRIGYIHLFGRENIPSNKEKAIQYFQEAASINPKGNQPLKLVSLDNNISRNVTISKDVLNQIKEYTPQGIFSYSKNLLSEKLGTTYRKLDPIARESLTIGYANYLSFLQIDTELDYSVVTHQIIRAVEIEIKKIFYTNFLHYLIKAKTNPNLLYSPEYYNLIVVKYGDNMIDYVHPNLGNFTLNNFKTILGLHQVIKEKVYTEDELTLEDSVEHISYIDNHKNVSKKCNKYMVNYCKKIFKGPFSNYYNDEISAILLNLVEDVDLINEVVRDPGVHSQNISKQQANFTVNLIIKVESILSRLHALLNYNELEKLDDIKEKINKPESVLSKIKE